MWRNRDYEQAHLTLFREHVLGNDNDVYLQRYKIMKEVLQQFLEKNPKTEHITIDEFLNEIFKKLNNDDGDLSPPKNKFANIIRKHKIGKLKLMRIRSNPGTDPKTIKVYIKALDNMLNIKEVKYKSLEEASLEVDVVLDLLERLDIRNVVYLKIKRISAIQMALIDVQNVDKIAILKRIDDLEEKLDMIIQGQRRGASKFDID